MKKIIFIIAIISLTSLTAFKVLSNKSAANAEQVQGLYVFLMSKPTSQYDYLGSVSKGVAWSGKPAEMLNSMIKKVKNEYPSADAILFTTIDMDKADAIKLKE